MTATGAVLCRAVVQDATQCAVDGQFALTVDDGPSTVTPDFLAKLTTAGAQVSFFVVGSMVATNPNTLVQELAQGHRLA